MHPPATTAWAVVFLLACYLSGRSLRRFRAEIFVTTLAIAASTALYLPTACTNLAAGAVLGLLLSLIADWPTRSITADEPALSRSVKTGIGAAVALAISAGLTNLSIAQSPEGTASTHIPSSTNIYRVLIPVDSEGHVVGSKYYVSQPFLRALIAAGSDSATRAGQWLLRDAAFSGELRNAQGHSADIASGSWTMSFSIETVTRDVKVILPLVRNEADWDTTAMLDGVPTPLEWRNGGRECVIEIPEPGRYLLAVSCVPKIASTDAGNQISLSIPPIAGAKVSLRFPESASAPTISHATIFPGAPGSTNVLTGELERIKQLSVQWLRAEVPETGKQGLIVTELRWLDIKPEHTELTIKYVVEGGGQRPDSLTVAYDDRWKLLTNEGSATAKPVDTNSSAQRIVRVPIPSQPSHRQEIRLRWQLTDPSPLAIIASRQSIWLALRPTNAGWQYQRLKLGIVILRIHPQRKARSTSSSRDGVPLTPILHRNWSFRISTEPIRWLLPFAPAKRNRLWMKRSTSPRASALFASITRQM